MIRCPFCNNSHYVSHYSMTTAMGWVQEYKDGIPINSNPNISTTYCTCCECGHDFHYSEQYGEIQEIVDDGRKETKVVGIKKPFTFLNASINIPAENLLVPSSFNDNNSITISASKEFLRLEGMIEKLSSEIQSLKKAIWEIEHPGEWYDY